ncbi:CaiB/BaiF CoA transferase family protein [Futiania mangrovi]|uniref:CoA transferase n=1 Tax=Futiania mangrovi TaxID=2959716 RepID=A0A9J6PGT2_9PROT|nr:CoA transferase [Futiania mangrovii]MCP1337032.1 CoA transferase [Futiania mangrovii]
MAGPLSGVRVLDFTAIILGPLASQILGDMGADVWKVEPPEGDMLRNVGPSRTPHMGPLFLHLNRNKRSIALDLRSEAARPVLARLIGEADVLMHNMRPKALAKLGLSYEDVCRINPRIIHCGAFGFGQTGPYADRPAYDDLIQGAVGLPGLQAPPGGEPRYVATAIVDRSVGLAMASAIGMALYAREKTGKGQAIEVPMFENMVQFVWSDHLYGKTFDPPLGPAGYPRMLDAERRPYRTSDGYISVIVYTDRHWQRFFERIGRTDLAQDPRYTTIKGRVENISWLYGFLAETFAARTSAEWLELLADVDIPAAPLLTADTLLSDPHLTATGFIQTVEHPSEGRLRTFGIPSSWSATVPEVARQAPRLGEHTVELCEQLGVPHNQIDALVASGAAIDGRAVSATPPS